ncbi:MAG: hypothetical protein HYS45_00190 [Parcubacteria group bacterium]|nr:hypothetical protein [Parcubacteria group bacterium]
MKKLFAGPLPGGTYVRLACQQWQHGPPVPLDCRRCHQRLGFERLPHPQSVFVKYCGAYYCAACGSLFPWDPEKGRFHFWITELPDAAAWHARAALVEFLDRHARARSP